MHIWISRVVVLGNTPHHCLTMSGLVSSAVGIHSLAVAVVCVMSEVTSKVKFDGGDA